MCKILKGSVLIYGSVNEPEVDLHGDIMQPGTVATEICAATTVVTAWPVSDSVTVYILLSETCRCGYHFVTTLANDLPLPDWTCSSPAPSHLSPWVK